jgi:alkaline phosphatase D
MLRLATAAAYWSATLLVSAGPDVTRIAFGSCCQQDRPVPIFRSICDFAPDVWIWMGDNIYGDTTDMEEMRRKYSRLAAIPDYKTLRNSCHVIGTWDDHDYGKNDAGREFTARVESQELLLDFLAVPADHPRRRRQGVYGSHTFGSGKRTVKVILLDTRYHREAPGPSTDILGEAQWTWLEGELRESAAAVHLLVSSIQVVPSDHRFEKWRNFPQAQKRLYALLSGEDIPPVTILSGDRHLAEISVEHDELRYPLHDITSSSLNQRGGGNEDEPNTRRTGENFRQTNFGTLEIDWDSDPPTLRFAVRDAAGRPVRTVSLQQGR